MQKSTFFLSSILAASIFLTVACNKYYKATKTEHPTALGKKVDSLANQNRYFILRSGTDAYRMSKLVLSEDRKSLKCVLAPLPENHQLHLSNGRNGNMKYIPKLNDGAVLNEVHLFVKNPDSINIGSYTLDLSTVEKIEVITKDTKRTTNSYVIGALGYTVGALAVVGIIVALTKSSCPFVSPYNNNEFSLQGEIYGGAIYPQLSRDDYMPLRMQPTPNGTLQLKISNELKERQYTDFADLIVVTHDKNTKVLSDEKGNLYAIKKPQSPLDARMGNGQDALAPLMQKDDNSILYFDDTLATNANNFVITEFDKPVDARKVKLVLAIKNSYWLDYLYGEMAKGFGSYYPTFIKKQNKTPVSKLLHWAKDQQLPLTVSIEKNAAWEKVAEVTTIGPLATREIVVPVDVSNIKGNSIKIKLSSGFMFWEIDYAAIDFSEEKDFTVESVSPSVATDETGKNVLPVLMKKDGVYLEQPVPGNNVTLEYKCKQQRPNESRSYILHTRGYYTHVRDYKGAPNITFLNQFKKPNGFPAFSVELYKKFSKTSMASLALQ